MEIELKRFKSQEEMDRIVSTKMGYYNRKPLDFTDEMDSILKELTQAEFCKEYIRPIRRINTEEVLDFFQTYTKGVRSTQSINLSVLHYILRMLSEDKFESKETLMASIEGNIRKVNPLSLEVKTALPSTFSAASEKALIIPENYSPDDLAMSKIFFSSIAIGYPLTEATTPTYIHELTHTMVDYEPGIVNDYLNREVLEMFMEKLSSYHKDETLYETVSRERYKSLIPPLKELKTSTDEYKKLRASTYIASAYKAEHLFELYLKATNKKEFLKGIIRVLDHDLSLEELLKDHEITLENSATLARTKKTI
jgi:hypothetical protein